MTTEETDATKVLAAKIEAYKEQLEKDFLAKSETWSAAHNKWQSHEDSVRKRDQQAAKQLRQQGQTCFNEDGSLSFLGGFQGESHLRQPLEVIRDLQRYCLQNMLKLRQHQIETLLSEFIDSMNHDLLIGRYDEKSKEQCHLRRNLWAAQTVQGSLNRRQGVSLSKADIIRKIVSSLPLI